MKIGIPREVAPGEKRVATTPEVAVQLQKLGFTVAIESGAGSPASFSDSAYTEAGVDMLRSERGPLIMEVNSSPGLEGIEMSTGIDVSEKIIQYIEQAAQFEDRRRIDG